MDLAVTIIHQHVGAQRDHGWIYRNGDIGRGSAAAGGDAICRVIRGLPATLLADAVMGHGHVIQTVGRREQRRLDQLILRFFRLLRRGIIPGQPPSVENGRLVLRGSGRLLGGLDGDRQSHAAGQSRKDQRQNCVAPPCLSDCFCLSGPPVRLPGTFCRGFQLRGGMVLLRQPYGLQRVHVGPELVNLPTDLLSSLTHLVPSLSAPVRCL